MKHISELMETNRPLHTAVQLLNNLRSSGTTIRSLALGGFKATKLASGQCSLETMPLSPSDQVTMYIALNQAGHQVTDEQPGPKFTVVSRDLPKEGVK